MDCDWHRSKEVSKDNPIQCFFRFFRIASAVFSVCVCMCLHCMKHTCIMYSKYVFFNLIFNIPLKHGKTIYHVFTNTHLSCFAVSVSYVLVLNSFQN